MMTIDTNGNLVIGGDLYGKGFNMINKTDKIVILGGTGWFGSHISKQLQNDGYTKVRSFGSKQYDLTRDDATYHMYRDEKPDVVIMAAALCGGILVNVKKPVEFYHKNAMMGQNVIYEWVRYARTYQKIKKLIYISTICAYPAVPPTIPFIESDLFCGLPEKSNLPYSMSKLSTMIMGNAAREQYGLNFITLMPTNLMGIGDNCDPQTSHVIPGLCNRIYKAKLNNDPVVKCLGTGNVTREFLNVKDASKGVVRAMEYYDSGEPCNLGSGEEISIKDLAFYISKYMDYNGSIIWDKTAPDGQKRRVLNTDKAYNEFGWKASIKFQDGLKEFVEWYMKEGFSS